MKKGPALWQCRPCFASSTPGNPGAQKKDREITRLVEAAPGAKCANGSTMGFSPGRMVRAGPCRDGAQGCPCPEPACGPGGSVAPLLCAQAARSHPRCPSVSGKRACVAGVPGGRPGCVRAAFARLCACPQKRPTFARNRPRCGVHIFRAFLTFYGRAAGPDRQLSSTYLQSCISQKSVFAWRVLSRNPIRMVFAYINKENGRATGVVSVASRVF